MLKARRSSLLEQDASFDEIRSLQRVPPLKITNLDGQSQELKVRNSARIPTTRMLRRE